MIQYFLRNKNLPAVLPEHFRLPSVEKLFPKHLIPMEIICQHRPEKVPLSDPALITCKANILTTTQVFHGRSEKFDVVNILLQSKVLLFSHQCIIQRVQFSVILVKSFDFQISQPTLNPAHNAKPSTGTKNGKMVNTTLMIT